MAIVGAAGRAASRKRRSKASANRILAHERFERERAKTSVWLVKFDANNSGALDRKELLTMMKFINEDDSVRYDGEAWG
jgi:Ca2+-binding EF-hand superfamily protein